ncbi:MoaD/ThiS family protein [Chloroflexota bacterium]
MSVKIIIPWFLQWATDNVKVVAVKGDTVGACLKNLVARFPLLEKELFDSEGRLSPLVYIHVDGRSIYSEGLNRPVRDDDELSLLIIVGGG